jgi:hypothetical protein
MKLQLEKYWCQSKTVPWVFLELLKTYCINFTGTSLESAMVLQKLLRKN